MSALEDAFVTVHSITRKNREATVTSSISNHNALLWMLREKGKIKKVSGGTEITRSVRLAENSTIQNYGGYDPLNVGDSQTTFLAKYDRVGKAIHVTASGEELRMNMGPEKMKDLVTEKQEAAEETAANRLAIELYGDGTAYRSINGLQNFLPTTGTGTVGGLDSTVYTKWQSKVQALTGGAPAAATIEKDVAALYKKCRVGKNRPDLGLASHDVYTELEDAIMQKTRYHGYMERKKANFDFEHIIFKNDCAIVYEENANFANNAELLYLLNCDDYELIEHPEGQFDFEKPIKTAGFDGITIPAYYYGQFITKRRRNSGVLYDAT